MKRTLIVLGIIAVFLFAYGVLLFEPATADCGGSSGCGMSLEKVQGQARDQQGITGDIEAQCQQIVDEFAALQDHFDMMMKLTNVGYLAEAMVKHQEMMTKFADDLAKHQDMCRQMAGMTSDSSSSEPMPRGHQH